MIWIVLLRRRTVMLIDIPSHFQTVIQKQNPVVILLLKVTSTPSSDKPKCLIKA